MTRIRRTAMIDRPLRAARAALAVLRRGPSDGRAQDAGQGVPGTDEPWALFDRPMLAAVPRSPALAVARRRSLPEPEAEAFRTLRANLRRLADDPQVVAVTSAGVAEGKTTVAMELAAAAAEAGERVLLVEGDLRAPVLAVRLRIDDARGLTTVLSGADDLPSVLERVPVGEAVPGRRPPGYDLLPAGPAATAPERLMRSARIRETLRHLRDWYETIVIDAPPSAAVCALPQIDGVVVVARVGWVTHAAAGELRDRLEGVGARVLGLVLNGVDGSRRIHVAGYAATAAGAAGDDERTRRAIRGRP